MNLLIFKNFYFIFLSQFLFLLFFHVNRPDFQFPNVNAAGMPPSALWVNHLYGTRFINYLAYVYSPEKVIEWLPLTMQPRAGPARSFRTRVWRRSSTSAPCVASSGRGTSKYGDRSSDDGGAVALVGP